MGCCSQSQPQQPDPYTDAMAAFRADLDALPETQAINRAAALGQKVTVGGKEIDFAGLGEADFQRAYADAMAQVALQLQKSLGPEFIAQRQKELEIADPEGVAGRKALYDRILADMAGAGKSSGQSMALMESVLSDLSKGASLSDREMRAVRNSVRGGQVARGQFLGPAAATQEARAVLGAGDAMQTERQRRALEYLASGASPDEISYRKTQQSLANLSDFMKGIPVTTQFGQLHGAQQGAAPTHLGSSYQMQGTNPNAGAIGVQWGSNLYGIQSDAASQQANPWMAGLGLGFQGLGAYYALGGATK